MRLGRQGSTWVRRVTFDHKATREERAANAITAHHTLRCHRVLQSCPLNRGKIPSLISPTPLQGKETITEKNHIRVLMKTSKASPYKVWGCRAWQPQRWLHRPWTLVGTQLASSGMPLGTEKLRQKACLLMSDR